jgi:hypothetical protein
MRIRRSTVGLLVISCRGRGPSVVTFIQSVPVGHEGRGADAGRLKA